MVENKRKWLSGYFRDWKNILTFIFLIILAAAGIFLRIRNLGYLSFWGDDGHTVIGTLGILKHGYPLLPSGYVLFHGIFDYYLNVIPVLLFGATEFAFRVTSVFFGVSTIILIYFVGKDMANKFVGFLSATVITFAMWFVHFSREARYFSAFQFFFLLSAYFFYKGFICNRKPFRVLTIIFFIITPLIHGMGFTLILFFIPLLFYRGRKFFRKTILVPLLIIFIFDALQVINQVFFWKVGRSFYTAEGGIRSLIGAYFRFPDPYYFKIINIMFPEMFAVFLIGIAVFSGMAIFLSVKRKYSIKDMYLNENEMAAGRLRIPFNIFMLYLVFVVTLIIISLGQMYNQQRYIYFLMPLFILIFSYVIFTVSFSLSKWIHIACKKLAKRKVPTAVLNIVLVVIFTAISFFAISGINLEEAEAISYIKHTDKLNTYYSISNTWSYHWDAAEVGKYVAANAEEDDLVITTDVYNSYPYTKRIDYWLWTGNLVSWQPYHEEDGEVRDDTYGAVVIRDIFKFIEVFNKNYDRNIWLIGSYSLGVPEHVNPVFRDYLDRNEDNLILTGRDDMTKLYFFPKSSTGERILITDFISSNEDNTIGENADGDIFVDFTDEAYSDYLVSGWGKIETGLGTWGLDGVSILYFDLGDIGDTREGEKELRIIAKPLPNSELKQVIAVAINGHAAGSIKLIDFEDFYEYNLIFKSEILQEGLNIVELRYNYSFTPLELGLSSDNRDLAVMFKELEIDL